MYVDQMSDNTNTIIIEIQSINHRKKSSIYTCNYMYLSNWTIITMTDIFTNTNLLVVIWKCWQIKICI